MEKTYRIHIDIGNDAFRSPGAAREVARILRQLAEELDLAQEPFPRTLRDVNGNQVGAAFLDDDRIADIPGVPESGPFELFYGTGGHGGPYPTFTLARDGARRRILGSASEDHIDIVHIGRNLPVWRIYRDGSEGVPLLPRRNDEAL